MSSRFLLRLEGVLVCLVALAGYAWLEGSWGTFFILMLLPDLLMIGYLGGPRMGALAYNLGHTYVGPLILGVVAFSVGRMFLVGIALIWTVHIGMDRALGYGLKRPTSFHDTHLSSDQAPISVERKARRTARRTVTASQAGASQNEWQGM